MQRVTAIALVSVLGLTNVKPARSQAQLLLPAACATGVGCVIVGTVVVSGIIYYIYEQQQTHRRYLMPITDPEEEARAMGKGHIVDQVIAGKQSDAEKRCKQKLGSRYKETRWAHSNRWDCISY